MYCRRSPDSVSFPFNWHFTQSNIQWFRPMQAKQESCGSVIANFSLRLRHHLGLNATDFRQLVAIFRQYSETYFMCPLKTYMQVYCSGIYEISLAPLAQLPALSHPFVVWKLQIWTSPCQIKYINIMVIMSPIVSPRVKCRFKPRFTTPRQSLNRFYGTNILHEPAFWNFLFFFFFKNITRRMF